MTWAVQRNVRTVQGLRRDTYVLSGFLGRYPVYGYVTPERLLVLELKARIQWRLSRPEPRRPLPA